MQKKCRVNPEFVGILLNSNPSVKSNLILNASNLISYYKDCYLADTRTLTINNFFNRRIENRFFIDGNDEILNGNIEKYPISKEYAEEVKSNLALYKTEKVLYCCAHFIVGRQHEVLRKESKICAPLFMYPAKIDQDEDGYFISVDLDKPHINLNFLNSLKKDNQEDLHGALSKESSQIEDWNTISRLKKILDQKIEGIITEDLLLYPMMLGEVEIKKMLQTKNLDRIDGFKIVPSVAFGVFKRSTNTRGIVTELQELSTTLEYSNPLRYLLTSDTIPDLESLPDGRTPSTLKDSQKQIIESVNNNVISLVIGPPGTGKSFTIASLALDFVSKGKSVLMVSKANQAVDVIDEKISRDLGVKGISLRAGKSGYKKELKQHLQNLLTQTRKRPKDGLESITDIDVELSHLDIEIEKYETLFKKRVTDELKWGKILANNSRENELIHRLKSRYIKWRNSLKTPHWIITKEFLESHEKLIRRSKDYIEISFKQKAHRSLYNSRKMFRDFLKSLTARRSSRKEELFKNIHVPTLLGTFPIWLVNMSDIYDVFPLIVLC